MMPSYFTQLVKKRWQETTTTKEKVACKAAQKAAEQKKAIEAAAAAQVADAATAQIDEGQATSSQGKEAKGLGPHS